MKLKIAFSILVVFSMNCFAGDDQSYCDYTKEKSEAERILLQSPKAVFGGGRSSTGTLNAVGLGISESLSSYLKGRLSNQIGLQDCEIYRHISAITKHVQYDLSNLELAHDKHRIDIIDSALLDLDKLKTLEQTKVAAGASTIIVVDLIDAAAQRLRLDRASLKQQVALTIVPELPDTRLDQLILETSILENKQQQIISKQNKFDNWDISVTAGAGSLLNNGFTPEAPVKPYVQITMSYSFGSTARNRALDKSGSAYSAWTEEQTLGPIHLARQLYTQIDSARGSSDANLLANIDYVSGLEKSLSLIKEVDTPEAEHFRTQLSLELTVAKVEVESARFDSQYMTSYLNRNFRVD